MTLKELCRKNNYTTDKGTTHTYLDVYDKLFKPFQNKKVNLLEVGIATGGSLKLWDDYFTKATICGVDILSQEIYEYSDKVILVHGDITKMQDVFGNIDIAIDDGSHFVKDQIAFIKLLWPIMNKGGLLIIEDVFDIDNSKKDFDELNIPYEIIDMRENNVPDNVLILIRKCWHK